MPLHDLLCSAAAAWLLTQLLQGRAGGRPPEGGAVPSISMGGEDGVEREATARPLQVANRVQVAGGCRGVIGVACPAPAPAAAAAVRSTWRMACPDLHWDVSSSCSAPSRRQCLGYWGWLPCGLRLRQCE